MLSPEGGETGSQDIHPLTLCCALLAARADSPDTQDDEALLFFIPNQPVLPTFF